jgi:hypothetical protein
MTPRPPRQSLRSKKAWMIWEIAFQVFGLFLSARLLPSRTRVNRTQAKNLRVMKSSEKKSLRIEFPAHPFIVRIGFVAADEQSD